MVRFLSFALHPWLREDTGRGDGVIVAWQELKRLVVNPSEALEGILARRGLGLSLTLGVVGYYWRTLQISEAIFPPSLGGRAYFLLNFPLALGWTALIVFLIHLAYRMVGRGKGRWGDLLLLWGYTQLPFITLTALATAFLLLAPPTLSIDLGIAWALFGLGVVLLLSLWNLILKFQAIKVCYDLSGKRLWAVIALSLLFYGAPRLGGDHLCERAGLCVSQGSKGHGARCRPLSRWGGGRSSSPLKS